MQSTTSPSNVWLPVLAVVRSCRSSWSRSGDGETGVPGEYVVKFSYEVHGTTFRGWYFAGTFHEPGETFEILYDPLCPDKNTGSENQGPTWARISAWVVGAALTAFFIWLSHRGYIGDLGE